MDMKENQDHAEAAGQVYLVDLQVEAAAGTFKGQRVGNQEADEEVKLPFTNDTESFSVTLSPVPVESAESAVPAVPGRELFSLSCAPSRSWVTNIE